MVLLTLLESHGTTAFASVLGFIRYLQRIPGLDMDQTCRESNVKRIGIPL
jgi:hypothetical protein